MRHYSEIITIDHEIRFGKPTIRGMSISVADIMGWLASGMSQTEILSEYNELTLQDIQAALAFAADRENRIKIAS